MSETSAVEVSVQIGAPPESVFPYFTDPVHYVQWMGSEADLEPVPGGLNRVRMGDGFGATGTFLEVAPPHILAFSWGFADNHAAQQVKHETERGSGSAMPVGSTRVTVTVKSEGAGTHLTLRPGPAEPRAVRRTPNRLADVPCSTRHSSRGRRPRRRPARLALSSAGSHFYDLIESARGLVWSVDATAGTIDERCMSSALHLGDRVAYRVVASIRPTPEAQPLEPSLEAVV